MRSNIIRFAFAADFLLALLPPLHWWAESDRDVGTVPASLVYLFGIGALAALSIVAAYAHDRGPRR